MKRSVLFLAMASMFWGCSTDLEINADYKDITVVYGLLNMRDSVHYVKINKAYLGAGDALLYAQIADSNEWADADITSARIHRKLNGTTVGTFDLEATTVTDREPGVFYSPNQRLYKFRDSDFTGFISVNGEQVPVYLDQNSEYELDLVVKGQSVTATTTIVNDFTFNGPDQNPGNEIGLKNSFGYRNWQLDWTSNRDGKRYEVSYRFNYREVRNNTDTSGVQSFTQGMGKVISSNSASFEPMSRNFEGQQFFSSLAGRIPSDPSVTSRIFVGIDFLVSVANDEFHTYLTLNEPISGIIEDRPTYSNISNGVGLFAGRYTREIIGKRLDGVSLNELRDGPFTANLLF